LRAIYADEDALKVALKLLSVKQGA